MNNYKTLTTYKQIVPTRGCGFILRMEAADCARLAAKTIGENQKLRAEKNDRIARLKKLALRLKCLEHELADVKAVLNKIIQ